MRVKFFVKYNVEDLEDSLNSFIKNKEVINIQFTSDHRAWVLYEG